MAALMNDEAKHLSDKKMIFKQKCILNFLTFLAIIIDIGGILGAPYLSFYIPWLDF